MVIFHFYANVMWISVAKTQQLEQTEILTPHLNLKLA